MTNISIYPIILAGGSGTRLWPLSRPAYPKQFSLRLNDLSLFQATVLRLSGDGFCAPVVITAEPFRFIVTEQLAAISVEAAIILLEPSPRDTAAAALAGAAWVDEHEPGACCLISPSDHAIPRPDDFRDILDKARSAAATGHLVTFGIKPDRPETAFGYIETAGDTDTATVVRFHEKPDPETAQRYLATKKHLWNAGLLLAQADTLLSDGEAHAPMIKRHAIDALDAAEPDLRFLRLDPEAWHQAPKMSLDHALLEKSALLRCVPFDGAWSDLGGWEAIHHYAEDTNDLDAAGNLLTGLSVAQDCSGTLLHAGDSDQALIGIGLNDMIAVATRDAVLVAPRAKAQDVKTAVAKLADRGAPQATRFPRDHRPWGWFETLGAGTRFQVKRIVVRPGGVLSLQSHMHRAEHWIVVAGTARVTRDDDVRLLSENESAFIPLGTKHRLENPGKVPCILIEVQTGAYLGEDDIERFEDIYGRDPNDG